MSQGHIVVEHAFPLQITSGPLNPGQINAFSTLRAGDDNFISLCRDIFLSLSDDGRGAIFLAALCGERDMWNCDECSYLASLILLIGSRPINV